MRHYQQELEAEVARKTAELRQAFDKIKVASLDTIYRLARAAEYRDEGTGAHIQRMSHYAAHLARRIGLNGEMVESILYAAPMHDIGKIGIPDHILLRPCKLEGAEWEIMKQHTVFGARILEGSATEFLQLAESIALTHHEKWDGRGYPRGLKGTEIPLAGRIAAVADVFEALTSNRPYRQQAFTTAEAFDLIREGRGHHFDPELVAAFLAAADELLKIKEQFKG